MIYAHITSHRIPAGLRLTQSHYLGGDIETEASRNFYFKQFVNDCCSQLKKGKCYYTTKKEHIIAIRNKCKFEIEVTDLKNGFYLLEMVKS